MKKYAIYTLILSFSIFYKYHILLLHTIDNFLRLTRQSIPFNKFLRFFLIQNKETPARDSVISLLYSYQIPLYTNNYFCGFHQEVLAVLPNPKQRNYCTRLGHFIPLYQISLLYTINPLLHI